MADRAESSALIAPPPPMREPSEVDLEAGPGEQIQCRICLETDGNLLPDRVLLLLVPAV